MAETYSQSLTGINAGSRYTAKVVQVGDTDAAGNVIGNSTNAGGQQGVMMRGNQVLCKNADGSQTWYTIDAERSVPGASLVMRPVGP
jgi:hypothetical protein